MTIRPPACDVELGYLMSLLGLKERHKLFNVGSVIYNFLAKVFVYLAIHDTKGSDSESLERFFS